MRVRLYVALATVGAGLFVLSMAKAQSQGEIQTPIEGQTEQPSMAEDQPDIVYPGGSRPDIANGRFVVVGGAAEGTATACFRCHGLQGAGDPTGAFPRLADQSAWYLFKALQDYATERRHNPIMTPIAKALTTGQMEDVAAYYAAIEDAPYPPPPEVDPQVLQMGGALSAIGAAEQGVQACVNCHGPEGAGMPPTYPYLAGQHAPYLELQLRLWKEGKRGGDPLNVMKNISERMTDEQIEAVSLYFASLRLPEVTPEDEYGKGAATAAEPKPEDEVESGSDTGLKD
jgi:cytochrome c553